MTMRKSEIEEWGRTLSDFYSMDELRERLEQGIEAVRIASDEGDRLVGALSEAAEAIGRARAAIEELSGIMSELTDDDSGIGDIGAEDLEVAIFLEHPDDGLLGLDDEAEVALRGWQDALERYARSFGPAMQTARENVQLAYARALELADEEYD